MSTRARSVARGLKSFIMTLADVVHVFSREGNRRFLFLIPVLLVIAALMAIVSSSGILAPFVYPLF